MRDWIRGILTVALLSDLELRNRGERMMKKRITIRLKGPDDDTPLNVKSWRIEAGWMVITESEDEENNGGFVKGDVKQVIIPPSWPYPIGIDTHYEEW